MKHAGRQYNWIDIHNGKQELDPIYKKLKSYKIMTSFLKESTTSILNRALQLL